MGDMTYTIGLIAAAVIGVIGIVGALVNASRGHIKPPPKNESVEDIVCASMRALERDVISVPPGGKSELEPSLSRAAQSAGMEGHPPV